MSTRASCCKVAWNQSVCCVMRPTGFDQVQNAFSTLTYSSSIASRATFNHDKPFGTLMSIITDKTNQHFANTKVLKYKEEMRSATCNLLALRERLWKFLLSIYSSSSTANKNKTGDSLSAANAFLSGFYKQTVTFTRAPSVAETGTFIFALNSFMGGEFLFVRTRTQKNQRLLFL